MLMNYRVLVTSMIVIIIWRTNDFNKDFDFSSLTNLSIVVMILCMTMLRFISSFDVIVSVYSISILINLIKSILSMVSNFVLRYTADIVLTYVSTSIVVLVDFQCYRYDKWVTQSENRTYCTRSTSSYSKMVIWFIWVMIDMVSTGTKHD